MPGRGFLTVFCSSLKALERRVFFAWPRPPSCPSFSCAQLVSSLSEFGQFRVINWCPLLADFGSPRKTKGPARPVRRRPSSRWRPARGTSAGRGSPLTCIPATYRPDPSCTRSGAGPFFRLMSLTPFFESTASQQNRERRSRGPLFFPGGFEPHSERFFRVTLTGNGFFSPQSNHISKCVSVKTPASVVMYFSH